MDELAHLKSELRHEFKLAFGARRQIGSGPRCPNGSDIELPNQQNDAQHRSAAQCPAGNVGGLFEAGCAYMVVGTYVDVLQAVSHCSLQ